MATEKAKQKINGRKNNGHRSCPLRYEKSTDTSKNSPPYAYKSNPKMYAIKSKRRLEMLAGKQIRNQREIDEALSAYSYVVIGGVHEPIMLDRQVEVLRTYYADYPTNSQQTGGNHGISRTGKRK